MTWARTNLIKQVTSLGIFHDNPRPHIIFAMVEKLNYVRVARRLANIIVNRNFLVYHACIQSMSVFCLSPVYKLDGNYLTLPTGFFDTEE